MIRRIIYVSRSLISAEPAGIDAIVSSSIKWNSEFRVTGMLWANGVHFAQVLEGEADNVRSTMDRILNDRRHADIDVLLDRAVMSRQFGNWSMRRAANDDASTHGTAFMLGFASGERTASTQRLYETILASDG
jgi:hypothetical protein